MTAEIAITHVGVVTGDRDGTVHEDWTVVIGPDGAIAAVGPADQQEVPHSAQVLDGRGKYLMPGIINAHAHLFSDGKPLGAIYLHPRMKHLTTRVMNTGFGQRLMRGRTERNALNQLHTGVTTIRTVGDVAAEVIDIRAQIEAGDLIGPRILPSGPLLSITNGHGYPQIAQLADSAEQRRENTRLNLANGSTNIKVSATGGVTDAEGIGHAGTPELTEETMRAICEEAHAGGVIVAAHAQSIEGVKRALRAGVDTIEHGSSMDDEIVELYRDNPRSLRGWSAMIPTLQACLPLVKLDRSVTGISEVVHANAVLVLEEMLSGIASALENDIALGMGTDSAVTYVTHSNTWRELDFLVRFGNLTPAQVLHAATQVNARILGLPTRPDRFASATAPIWFWWRAIRSSRCAPCGPRAR